MFNKATLGRLLMGSATIGSSPGKLGGYTQSPTTITGVRVYTSGTITPGAVSAQTAYTTTVTCTGVRAGDSIHVIPPVGVNTSLMFVAYVSANDTVTLNIVNATAGSITPAAAVWKFHHTAFYPGNV